MNQKKTGKIKMVTLNIKPLKLIISLIIQLHYGIKSPKDLKDEDYKSFYKELYPFSEEPLFWIHLKCRLSIQFNWYTLFS